jgi:hypothetical protein
LTSASPGCQSLPGCRLGDPDGRGLPAGLRPPTPGSRLSRRRSGACPPGLFELRSAGVSEPDRTVRTSRTTTRTLPASSHRLRTLPPGRTTSDMPERCLGGILRKVPDTTPKEGRYCSGCAVQPKKNGGGITMGSSGMLRASGPLSYRPWFAYPVRSEDAPAALAFA